MKYKTLLLFCSLQLVACSLFSQVGVDSLYKSQTIGNTLRNQRCGNGLQIEDSLITNGISIFNDNVGIGTVSPDFNLHVAGSFFAEKTVGGRTVHMVIDTFAGFTQILYEFTSGDTSNVMGVTPGDAFMRSNMDGTDYDVIMNITDPAGVKIQGKSTTTGNALTILEGDTTIFGGDTLYRFGNNGTMQVYGMAGAGTRYVTADSVGHLGVALTLPPNDGKNGFYLQTDGAGVAIWAAPSLTINAGAMIAQETSGATAATEESTTNDRMRDVYLFDTTEYVQAYFIPNNTAVDTVSINLYWDIATGASANDTIRWCVAAAAIGNDDSWDGSWGTEVCTNDLVIAVNDIHITSAIEVVPSGTPQAGDLVWLRIKRNKMSVYVPEHAKLISSYVKWW